MLILNAKTKISAILKQQPDALEAIISISPKFEKLRNPLLRKLMAGRASVGMASKIAGCSIQDFYNKLTPLGFHVDASTATEDKNDKQIPDFLVKINPAYITELDVRPVLDNDKDPLTIILEKIKLLQTGQVLKIINSFEPTPLMQLLQKQGFLSYAERVSANLVFTYFYKTNKFQKSVDSINISDIQDWDELMLRFDGNMQILDVRQLEMPLPMHTILEALDILPSRNALFVYHKRIPVFLLPELAERKLEYRIKELTDGSVHILIFKS